MKHCYVVYQVRTKKRNVDYVLMAGRLYGFEVMGGVVFMPDRFGSLFFMRYYRPSVSMRSVKELKKKYGATKVRKVILVSKETSTKRGCGAR